MDICLLELEGLASKYTLPLTHSPNDQHGRRKKTLKAVAALCSSCGARLAEAIPDLRGHATSTRGLGSLSFLSLTVTHICNMEVEEEPRCDACRISGAE